MLYFRVKSRRYWLDYFEYLYLWIQYCSSWYYKDVLRHDKICFVIKSCVCGVVCCVVSWCLQFKVDKDVWVSFECCAVWRQRWHGMTKHDKSWMCHDMNVYESGALWACSGVQWCVIVCGEGNRTWKWNTMMKLDIRYSSDVDMWHVRQYGEGGRVLPLTLTVYLSAIYCVIYQFSQFERGGWCIVAVCVCVCALSFLTSYCSLRLILIYTT